MDPDAFDRRRPAVVAMRGPPLRSYLPEFCCDPFGSTHHLGYFPPQMYTGASAVLKDLKEQYSFSTLSL